MAVSVHAELKQPSSCSIEATEDKIVYNFDLAADDPRNNAVKKLLAELNIENIEHRDMLLVHSDSTECCLICTSAEQLMQLRRHFESGVMKNVLQNIFTLMMNGDELIVIDQLKWDPKNNWGSVQQFSKLKPLG